MIIDYDKTKPIFADLSHYRQVKDVDAFVRASTGGLMAFKVNEDAFNDGTMQGNIDIALQHNLIQLGYEYDHDGNADKFLSRFPPSEDQTVKRIPCIDCEATDLTFAEVEKWIQTVRGAYGYLPWVYGRDWFVNAGAHRIKDSIIAQCHYWASEYGRRLYVPAGLKPEKTIAWQFTNGTSGPMAAPHKFPGVGPCDISSLLFPVDFSLQP